jgi:hypothetical protein
MPEGGAGPSTILLSRHWHDTRSELSFVARSVAGAVSRAGAVAVLVPRPGGTTHPDGAFDLVGIGQGAGGDWPAPDDTRWPESVPAGSTVVVDVMDDSLQAIVEARAPSSPIRTIAPLSGSDAAPSLPFVEGPGTHASEPIGMHVPINPLAAGHRHIGLGFTGYLLVLSDRTGPTEVAPPTSLVAWLTAGFPDDHVVVVEEGMAAVWRGRALRGTIPVDTRTDLWRLLAHARMTIDLAPGPVIGRECIESLRFGTPIVVPTLSVAHRHALAGGGQSYADYADLLEGVARLHDDAIHSSQAAGGRSYADALFGNPTRFVEAMARVLGDGAET